MITDIEDLVALVRVAKVENVRDFYLNNMLFMNSPNMFRKNVSLHAGQKDETEGLIYSGPLPNGASFSINNKKMVGVQKIESHVPKRTYICCFYAIYGKDCKITEKSDGRVVFRHSLNQKFCEDFIFNSNNERTGIVVIPDPVRFLVNLYLSAKEHKDTIMCSPIEYEGSDNHIRHDSIEAFKLSFSNDIMSQNKMLFYKDEGYKYQNEYRVAITLSDFAHPKYIGHTIYDGGRIDDNRGLWIIDKNAKKGDISIEITKMAIL